MKIQDDGYLLMWEKGRMNTEASNVGVVIYKSGRHIGIIIYILTKPFKCKQ